MPINNQQGLDALKALSTGGSPALDAYRQAQSNESASRTSALQNALGNGDVLAAAQKAQAQYSPQVAGDGLGVGNLDVAANSYLSDASNKLAAQNYQDQQNLALQAAKLSAKNQEAQLQGAADIMGQKQQANLEQNLTLGDQLNNLANRKAGLREQLTQHDARSQGVLQQAGIAAASGNAKAAQDAIAQQAAQRENILRQMGALDQQYAAASGQYAGLLGTDNKGFLDAYAKADQGNTQAIRDLNSYLAPQREAALEQGTNAINVGGQERLRALAPAFGIDALTAAGKYREGEGQDLQRQNAINNEQAYVAGTTANQQAASDEEVAPQFGFSSGKDFSAFKKSVDMNDQAIKGAMGSSEWGVLGNLADAVTNGKDMFQIPGSEQQLPLGSGKEGLNEAIQQVVNNEQNPLVHQDGTPYTDAEKANLVRLAQKYYVNKAYGKGQAADTGGQ